jgi:tryptophanyl-tRNA synthetase
MSKSAETEAGLIKVLDPAKVTTKKIMRAVTDDGAEIRFDRAEKPGVSNLLTIFSVLGDRTIESLENEFEGRGYGDLKKAVAEVVDSTLAPVRERTEELMGDPAELDRLLARGAERANELASATLDKVYDAMGLLRP